MIIDGSECEDLNLPNLVDLDFAMANKVCKLSDWSVFQACCAAFDKWPASEGTESNINFNAGSNTLAEMLRLKVALVDSINSGRITSRQGTSRKDRSVKVDYVEPLEFAKWLHEIHYSKNIQLFRHFSISIPVPFINNRASIADIPDDIKNEIDLGYPDPGSKKCWAEVRYIQYVAKYYMQRQIDEAHCNCRHDKLAQYVYDNFIWENKPLIDSDIMNRNLLGSLKELALLVVPPERRFGWRDENEVMHYNKDACKCEIPGHR